MVRARTAAEHEDARRTARCRRHLGCCRLLPTGGDPAAHRVAGHHRARTERLLGLRKADADPARERRQDARRRARARVLLEQDHRHAAQDGRQDRGERGVATDPDDELRAEAEHQTERAEEAPGNAPQGAHQARDSLATQPADRQQIDREAGPRHGGALDAVAAADEAHLGAAARLELVRDRDAGKEMSAGSAAGDQDTLHHRPPACGTVICARTPCRRAPAAAVR